MSDTYSEIKSELELSKRKIIISDALNRAVEIFTAFNEESFEDVLSNGLRPICEAVEIERIAVYRVMDDGSMGQVYLWAHGKTVGLDKELIRLPDIPCVLQWVRHLKKCECVNGRIDEMTDDEAAFLKTFNVKSILMAPIFTYGKFWGTVTLEDHKCYRYFDEHLLDLLCSAARLCANVLIRAEAEREQKSANEFNLAMLQGAPFAITIVDEALSVIDCNEGALEMFKTSKHHYINKFFDFSPEIQPDGLKSEEKAKGFLRRAVNGERVTFEWLHINSLGETIHSEITLARATKDGQNVIISYQYDLNNFIKAKKEAMEAQELANVIKEASPISYVLFDENMQAIDCNNAFMTLLGCSDKEYILDRYWQVFQPTEQPDGNDSFDKAVHMTKKTETKTITEWYHRSLEGELIPVENTFTWFIHKGKKFAISFKYDLREIKKLINELRKKSGELEIAFEKATEASKAKSVFLSNMSHEMRTPLNAIIGMTAITKNTDDSERKKYALQKIEDASTHLLGVISDVLDMSKIEANMLELSPIEFNFESMLQKVTTVIHFRADEKEINFSVHIDDGMPKFIIGDDQRMAQVITNLLSNAVKFTREKGKIRLDAYLAEEANGICTIRIEVTDSGIGISKEQQQKLFHSFVQAESGISREFGGTGLGLSISQQIAEMMDGSMAIESELGKGSKFIFTLKAARGQRDLGSLLNPGVNWSNIRVMVVDDDEEILNYFKNLFEPFGVKCDLTVDGIKACKMIEEYGDYDVYFVDWRMPDMDGIELTQKIKAHSANRRCVVIMISSTDWVAIKDDALSAGVNKYLLKPLFSSTIIDCINECLDCHESYNDNTNSQDTRGDFAGKTLLLAEDIDINREIVISLLEDTGLTIECAENGKEAVAMVKAAPERYDIIFMDVQMPKMDGLEATRRIRTSLAKIDIYLPIVALTANVFKHDIEECHAAGMDAHLSKPLDVDEVFSMLRKYLKKRKRKRKTR